MEKRNTLIFLTANYPYGFGEAFIEGEMPFLAEAFEKIILISNDLNNEQTRSTPDNVELFRFPYELSAIEKLFALFQLFNPLFWKEFKQLSFYKLKPSKPIVSTILFSLYKGKKLIKYMKGIMQKEGVSPEQAITYSYWSNDTAVGLAMLKNELPTIKAVSRGHRWDIYFENASINYLPFRKLMLETLDAVISISQDGIEYIKSKWGVEQLCFSKLRMSKLGVFNEFPFSTEKQNAPFLIVSCSYIITRKRVDLIVQALGELNLPVKWFHFGDGPQAEEVKQLAAEKLSSTKTEYTFAGAVSNTELLEAYAAKKPSLFINVSSSEGIPVSIMEAMSFGIPAIATDVGGNNEILRHQENGLLLASDPTVNEVAEAIKYFVTLDAGQYSTYVKEARKTWEREYNAELNYKEFVGLLKE
ncbi:glycosyltransferase [Flammeovirgaceae bacterium SG7u.111]|nr:glycosyltransferase [Flammeovirgaceae bacterium SG7u.132]WPO34982.1 glycosyltransferase [Flammeovirgaceae bacterium SG7u.111]